MTQLRAMTETLSAGDPPDVPLSTTAGRRRGYQSLIDPSSPALVYLGVVVVVIGFVMLGVGWSEIAGTTDVWRQMPYLLSAGLPGIGLVMTGLVFINVAIRRQDAARRQRESAVLAEALRDLQRSLDRDR